MNSNKIEAGTSALDFSLLGSDDSIHSLSGYRGKKIVLYFYPKDSTSGWTNEAISFRDNIKELGNHNVVVLGISRDSIPSHKKFIEKYSLPFILLSDPEEEACKLYDVLKEKNMYGKKSIGVERSTFIIDENGIIRKIFRKVKVDGHIDEVLKAIDSINWFYFNRYIS